MSPDGWPELSGQLHGSAAHERDGVQHAMQVRFKYYCPQL